ncbi:MAG TPA: zf-HC2 domain-containing protein [Vicinamibacteria bacterium]|jgi:anti-sigma factor (TIGR02949 family)
MNCDDLLRRLTDYQDGALDEAICEEIRGHLSTCDPCSDVQRDLEDLVRLCACAERPRMPADLRRRLLERLRGAGS